jgi:hypothetical protein
MMRRRFAQTTKVPVSRSREEIERALTKYGADQFVSGWERGRSMLGFRVKSRQVRFELPLPAIEGTARQQADAEQEHRRRWRALLLVIKAKLEAVSSDISTFEHEFLAHIVLPNNQTVASALLPQLAEAYKTGTMPRLLGPAIIDGEVRRD